MAKSDSGACCDGMPTPAETMDTKDSIRSSCVKNEGNESNCCKVELHSSARHLPGASTVSRSSRSRHSRSRSIILRRRLCAARRRELSRSSLECSSNLARFEVNARNDAVGEMQVPRTVYPMLSCGDVVSPQVASYSPHGLPCFAGSSIYPWMSPCCGYSLSSLPVMVQIPFMCTMVPNDPFFGYGLTPQHVNYDWYFQ